MKYAFFIVALLLLTVCSKKTEENSATTTAISFENLRVEEISARRAVIRFQTSSPTTCEAEYGLAEDSLVNTTTDPSMEDGAFEFEHEVPIEDLSPETVYYYRARATDTTGSTVYSDVRQFTTLSSTAATEFTNVATLSRGAAISEVSSNFGMGGNSSTWGANNAIDGSMSSEWATNNNGDNAYLVIDLGQTFSLLGVGFRSRKMSDGSSIITSFKLIFDNQAELGPFATPDPDKVYSFDFTSPIASQTVRFEAVTTSGGNTGARAIQLFIAN